MHLRIYPLIFIFYLKISYLNLFNPNNVIKDNKIQSNNNPRQLQQYYNPAYSLIKSKYQSNCKIDYKSKIPLCWGQNFLDKTHEKKYNDVFNIIRTQNDKVDSIALGSGHTCFIHNGKRINNDMVCFGLSDSGQLDLPSRNISYDDDDVNQLNQLNVAAGQEHTCVIFSKNWENINLSENKKLQLECFGNNNYGQNNFTEKMNISSIQNIFSGNDFNCFLNQNLTTICYGNNNFGQIDIPNNWNENVTYLATAKYHLCMLSKNGFVHCIGKNHLNQFPDVNKLRTALTYFVETSQTHSCMIQMSGHLECTGMNLAGSVAGIPDAVRRSAVRVAVGFGHSCAVGFDNSTRCWGENKYGQLNVP